MNCPKKLETHRDVLYTFQLCEAGLKAQKRQTEIVQFRKANISLNISSKELKLSSFQVSRALQLFRVTSFLT